MSLRALVTQQEIEMRQMVKQLEEALTMIDHPFTIMTCMQNIQASANRVTFAAGKLKGLSYKERGVNDE